MVGYSYAEKPGLMSDQSQSTPLDRNSPLPLWAQLEQSLRQRLEGGEFDEGFFPTDQELTTEYQVSRHTVREAVRHLNKTGLLKRERGRGTVVNRAEFEQSMGTLYSLFQSVESTGVEQTSEVLTLETVTDTVAASQLGVPEDTELLLLARLRLAGGQPLAVDRAWLAEGTVESFSNIDWGRTALYTELAKLGHRVPNQGWERLTPIIPTSADRKLLDLRKSDAAFFLERLGKRDGEPVEWRTTTVRGDRFRFVSDWTAGAHSQLRPNAA